MTQICFHYQWLEQFLLGIPQSACLSKARGDANCTFCTKIRWVQFLCLHPAFHSSRLQRLHCPGLATITCFTLFSSFHKYLNKSFFNHIITNTLTSKFSINSLWPQTCSTCLKHCKFSFLYVRDFLIVFFLPLLPLQYKHISQQNPTPSLTQTSVLRGIVINHTINPFTPFSSPTKKKASCTFSCLT